MSHIGSYQVSFGRSLQVISTAIGTKGGFLVGAFRMLTDSSNGIVTMGKSTFFDLRSSILRFGLALDSAVIFLRVLAAVEDFGEIWSILSESPSRSAPLEISMVSWLVCWFRRVC